MLGAALVAALVLPMALSAGAAPLGTPDPAVPGPAADGSAEDHRVVLLGTAGLRWDDVNTLATPALWELSRQGGIGTVAARSLRSSACPADGWLAVSAGRRAADLPGEGYGECRALREPAADGAVPGWADYQESADASPFDPRIGLLGDVLTRTGVRATGVGPGAAIALAGSDGAVVGDHQVRPTQPAMLGSAVAAALGDSRLVVVDVGEVRDTGRATVPRPVGPDPTPPDDGSPAEPGPDLAEDGTEPLPEPAPTGEEPVGPEVIREPTRAEQVRPVDERVGAVLDALDGVDHPTTVLVVSLADSGTRARMQLAAALGPAPSGAPFEGSLLGSAATRQDGMTQATDVAPTIAHLLGVMHEVPDVAFVGSPVEPVDRPAAASERFLRVLDVDQHSQAVRPVTPPFVTWLIVINLALQLVVSIGLNGRVIAAVDRRRARWRGPTGGRATEGVRRPRAALQGLRVAGVVVGALPAASFLANATPWWRSQTPTLALAGLVTAWIGAITVLALLPRWRNPVVGPMGVVAGVTALVLAVDVATGATLQVSAPMGVQPVVAGRFYGFNNTAFAIFAAALILTLAAVTDPLVRAGRRRAAATVVAVVGAAATVLIGLPGLGSDFGGPPAVVPGLAVLALLVAGVRLSWLRFALVLVAGAVVVSAFVVVDWLRPVEDRTHLGRFMDTVIAGEVATVIRRNLAQNLANLGGTWLTLLALGGIALVVMVLVRPLRHAASAPDGGPYAWLSSGEPLTSLPTEAPTLPPAVTALAVTLGIGFLVNDSGIVIPAMGVAVAVPLLVTVCASWLLRVREERLREQGEPTSASPGAEDRATSDA